MKENRYDTPEKIIKAIEDSIYIKVVKRKPNSKYFYVKDLRNGKPCYCVYMPETKLFRFQMKALHYLLISIFINIFLFEITFIAFNNYGNIGSIIGYIIILSLFVWCGFFGYWFIKYSIMVH